MFGQGVFLASNSLYDPRGQKKSCPCNNTMPSIPSRSKITTMALIDKMGQSFDSLQTVLWHSLCSLHGVFGWSASGIGKSSGSLPDVSRGLCAVFRHSMGLLGGLWAVYNRLQTIFEDPQEVLCCSLGSLWPVCSVLSVFGWSSGGFLICNQSSIFSNMEVERLFSLMI